MQTVWKYFLAAAFSLYASAGFAQDQTEIEKCLANAEVEGVLNREPGLFGLGEALRAHPKRS